MLLVLKYKCRNYNTTKFAIHQIKRNEVKHSIVGIDQQQVQQTINLFNDDNIILQNVCTVKDLSLSLENKEDVLKSLI